MASISISSESKASLDAECAEGWPLKWRRVRKQSWRGHYVLGCAEEEWLLPAALQGPPRAGVDSWAKRKVANWSKATDHKCR